MMCFRDRSFCNLDDCVHWGYCDRAYTEEVQKAAEELRLPVMFSDFTEECFETGWGGC